MNPTTSSRQLTWFAFRCILLAALLMAAVPQLIAQFRASLSGTVTDPTGAVIPGASVALRDLATNRTLTARTNRSGVYVFNQLPPDHFALTVSSKGFRTKLLPDVS